MDISFFLLNVYEAATVSSSLYICLCAPLTLQRVCTAVKEEFSPKHYLPYLPDTNFVMCSYAVRPTDPELCSAKLTISAFVPAQALKT